MGVVIKIEDNSTGTEPLSDDVLRALAPFAGQTLKELAEDYKGLLVFPQSFGENQDGIGEQSLFDLCAGKLCTGNVLGFLGINGVQLSIQSRFDSGDKQYFLHYMLHRVFGINMVSLNAGIHRESIWDFLLYLFPCFLQRAIRQGVFKAYRQFEYNDNRLRGTVDIARHLRENLPFSGSITYHTREHSANNHLMQLVRHTIESILANKGAAGILRADVDIRRTVESVVAATPTYLRMERQKIIAKNLRPVQHPYFTEYMFLQKLCLKILRHEKVSYGEESDQIHGILFDGAWLWEEYLATILEPCGFKHPQNKTGKEPSYLYQSSKKPIYPDFLKDGWVVDAKYKRIDANGISREDRFQIIAYLHVTQAACGYFAFPTRKPPVRVEYEGRLNGFGGLIGKLPFLLPSSSGDFLDFANEMNRQESFFSAMITREAEIL